MVDRRPGPAMSPHGVTRRRFTTAVGLGGLAVAGSGAAAARGGPQNYRAHLSGDEEVPPVDTNAQGQAVFQLDRARETLSYKLIVANIEDVFMAHIHMAPAGANGPVVAWLYPAGGPPPVHIPGRFNGVLAEASLDKDDLVGPLAGMTMDVLISEIEAGNTYVNVHTLANPGGEVRGQIH